MALTVTKWMCLDRRTRREGPAEFRVISAQFASTPKQLRLLDKTEEVEGRLGYGTLFGPNHSEFHDSAEAAIAHRIECLKKQHAQLETELAETAATIKQVESLKA